MPDYPPERRPRVYFRYTLDPSTLTPCPYRRKGSQSPAFIMPRFKAALRKARDRTELVRRNTLLILVRLGFPVSLWHWLVPSPLPTDPAALAPQTGQVG